jgi:hypothetical protein
VAVMMRTVSAATSAVSTMPGWSTDSAHNKRRFTHELYQVYTRALLERRFIGIFAVVEL